MKKIFIVSILFLILCSGIQTIDPATLAQEKIFNFPGKSKIQLYEKSKQWLAYYFRSSKSVIDYENEKIGKIIGNISLQCGMLGFLRMKLTIDAKNNKTTLGFVIVP
jgi:hypothetical protein